MKKPLLLTTLLIVILLISFFYYNHKQNELAAFNYAKEFVVNEYNESTNLSPGGTRYDFGRGNYFVIVQNQQEKKYYLEVKLDDDKGLVSIEDNTGDVISGQ